MVVFVPKVHVYTTPFCGYCGQAKRLLEAKGVAYEEVDVSRDLPRRRWLYELTRRTSVPQVVVDGVPWGGFTDLLALDRAGRLDAILGLVPGADPE